MYMRCPEFEERTTSFTGASPSMKPSCSATAALRLLQHSSCSSGRQYLCFPSLVSPQEQRDVMKSLFPLRQLDCFAVSVNSARIYISRDNQK